MSYRDQVGTGDEALVESSGGQVAKAGVGTTSSCTTATPDRDGPDAVTDQAGTSSCCASFVKVLLAAPTGRSPVVTLVRPVPTVGSTDSSSLPGTASDGTDTRNVAVGTRSQVSIGQQAVLQAVPSGASVWLAAAEVMVRSCALGLLTVLALTVPVTSPHRYHRHQPPGGCPCPVAGETLSEVPAAVKAYFVPSL